MMGNWLFAVGVFGGIPTEQTPSVPRPANDATHEKPKANGSQEYLIASMGFLPRIKIVRGASLSF
jgi:hypothetical protein